MDEQKLRKQDIIDRAGFHGSTFHTWIKRDALPQVDDALKLADVLGVSVRYLVTGLDDEQLPHDIREIVKLCYSMDPVDRQTAYRMLQQFQRGQVRKEKGVDSPGTSDSVAL
jgi:hypothetical protein